MFSSVAIVKAITLSHLKEDRNTLLPIMLQCVAGNSVNKCTISGTVAKNAGFQEGYCYLVSINEIESDEYGRQFRFDRLMPELGAKDLIDAIKSFGPAKVLDVTKVTVNENGPKITI